MTQQPLLNQEERLDPEEIAFPDISDLVIEDDTPVDNFQSAKQQRLLVEPLYSSWKPGIPFIADANVGLFYAIKQDPLVPDVMLSLNVTMPGDWSQKQNRSYFVWQFGKVPDVCIEIVSNRKGKELGTKKDDYARVGVPYYVVFDPLQQLQGVDELNGALFKVWALNAGRYQSLPQPWLETVGLGLMLWEGEFEGMTQVWLRWCQQDGTVIPTGNEQADQEKQRADQEKQRADRLAERLRSMGVDLDEI